MASLLILVVVACLLCILTPLQRLYTNYKRAKQTGLRVLLVPVDPQGVFWPIVSRACAPLFQHFAWCRIIDTSWSWQDDASHHAKYGETFIVVSHARNIIYTSDKIAIDEVLANRKVFIKPKIYEIMDLFGKNVDTVNGEEWTRHRKITAPCFNERVSSFVWDEAIRQSQSMLAHWLSQPAGRVSGMVDDTRIIALHVLYAAGFGVKQDFHGGARKPAPGHHLSHRDALMTILNNLITSITVAPRESFFDSIQIVLSSRVSGVLLAVKEFRQYMDEAIASERKLQSEENRAQKHNLMSTLIRTSDQAKAGGLHSTVQLSDDEIKGNIFIFNLAGHDTTANTLAYAFALLAIHPDIQNWVIEEIDQVLGDSSTAKYEDAYPRLKRVLAVMYETLRLYGPVTTIPRGVIGPNALLTVSNPNSTSSDSETTTLIIPPNTELALSMHAMHTTPTNYPDHKVWNPKRWIDSSASALPQSTSSPSSPSKDETFVHLNQGFVAWSSGPRICPGMKFSQVEFVGVLSTVLKRAWVAPSVKGDGEVSATAARKEILALLRDSGTIGATLSMKRPEELWLEVSRREVG